MHALVFGSGSNLRVEDRNCVRYAPFCSVVFIRQPDYIPGRVFLRIGVIGLKSW